MPEGQADQNSRLPRLGCQQRPALHQRARCPVDARPNPGSAAAPVVGFIGLLEGLRTGGLLFWSMLMLRRHLQADLDPLLKVPNLAGSGPFGELTALPR